MEDLYVVKAVNQWPAPAPPPPYQGPTILPQQDPQPILDRYQVVFLVPGETYNWKYVRITYPVTIFGNGATVTTNGLGPIIRIDGTGQSSGRGVTIKDITFIGSPSTPDRLKPMSEEQVASSAIWVVGQWRTSILDCNFYNFSGAALYFGEHEVYNGFNWAMQHFVRGCRFKGCRIGIANGGATEYSVASMNNFFDCQICFNTVGGNWNCSSNVISNCRCAYLHTQHDWYQGPAGNYNAAHGSFTGNTLNHCDYGGNLWPTEFVLEDGTTIELAGFYFDDTLQRPPTWTGNTQYYGDMMIKNFLVAGIDAWCVTGCAILGKSGQNPDAGKVELADAVKNKVWFVGCSGNGVTLKNVVAANCTPPFGTIK